MNVWSTVTIVRPFGGSGGAPWAALDRQFWAREVQRLRPACVLPQGRGLSQSHSHKQVAQVGRQDPIVADLWRWCDTAPQRYLHFFDCSGQARILPLSCAP